MKIELNQSSVFDYSKSQAYLENQQQIDLLLVLVKAVESPDLSAKNKALADDKINNILSKL